MVPMTADDSRGPITRAYDEAMTIHPDSSSSDKAGKYTLAVALGLSPLAPFLVLWLVLRKLFEWTDKQDGERERERQRDYPRPRTPGPGEPAPEGWSYIRDLPDRLGYPEGHYMLNAITRIEQHSAEQPESPERPSRLWAS